MARLKKETEVSLNGNSSTVSFYVHKNPAISTVKSAGGSGEEASYLIKGSRAGNESKVFLFKSVLLSIIL